MTHQFKPGQLVTIDEETIGDDAFGNELKFPAGTTGWVESVDRHDDELVVTVCIGNVFGDEPEGMIVNVFEGNEIAVLKPFEWD